MTRGTTSQYNHTKYGIGYNKYLITVRPVHPLIGGRKVRISPPIDTKCVPQMCYPSHTGNPNYEWSKTGMERKVGLKLNIGTWNVKTIRVKGKRENLKQ